MPNKSFALVDAEGSFGSAGRGRSYVHSAHATIEAATRAAARTANVQIICGARWEKGEIVYQDAVGRIYPRA